MSDKLIVYSYRRCPFAMRVRIALHEKDIPFEVIEEDLKSFSEDLRKLHPEAKVPVLVHGRRVIYESAIITEYVDDLPSAKNRVMPLDPGLRAEVRLWTYWCNTQFKPELDRFKYGTSRFTKEECEGVQERLVTLLQKLENSLINSTWLVGNQLSLAEINLFPFLRQLCRIQPTPTFLSEFKNINRWREQIAERDSVTLALAK